MFLSVGKRPTRGIWDKGSSLFMEIARRFSIDKLTGTDLSLGRLKDWCFADNFIYDISRNAASLQSTWYMGLGADIDTHSDLTLLLYIYAKYQWQYYGANNENSWDGYGVKVNYL